MSSTLRRLAVGFILLPLVTRFAAPLDAAEPADPRRPAAIVTEDVPVVPAEVFERLAQYQNVRGAGFQGWWADGRGMLIRTRFGNASQLHRVHVPGGRREQLTFFDEPVNGAIIPKAGDGSLLVLMSRGGSEDDQIHLLDGAKFRAVLLTDGKSRNLLGPIRRDGSTMIVASNRRNGRDTDLYLADCRRPDSMKMILQVDGAYWYASDWSPDGDRLLLVRHVSVNESYPHVMDVATNKVTPLPAPGDQRSAGGQRSAVGQLTFAADGKTIYLTSDAEGEFRRLGRLVPGAENYEWLTLDIPWDVNDVEVEPQSGVVAFTTNEDGASSLYLVENGRRRALKLPLGIVAGLEFSPDGQHLGFTLARPDAPADAYSVRLAGGELTRWTFSEVGGLDPASFVVPERIRYPSFDERRIPAFYYRPRDASASRKAPVLIQIHGGPEGQALPYFSSAVQFHVNEMGMAVLAPNVRGSSGYGKTYLTLDNGPLREDSVRDIGALLDWIASQDELDASRVAVAGGSYGGYMVLASLVHYSDRLKAGIDIVGIANFITFLENTAPYRVDLRRVEYGDERDPAMRAVFERINPSSNAEKIRAALLVAHGRNDPRVPFSEAEQIADRVRRQGRPVWTVYADNEGHGFAKKENADYLRAVEVMFLKKSLAIE